MELLWILGVLVWVILLRFVHIWSQKNLNWWSILWSLFTRDSSSPLVKRRSLFIRSFRNWVLSLRLGISLFLRFMRNIVRKLAILLMKRQQNRKSHRFWIVSNHLCMHSLKKFYFENLWCGVFLHTFFILLDLIYKFYIIYYIFMLE